MKEYILMLKNTFNFTGKASRSEYWMAVLFNLIFSMLLFVLVLPFIADYAVALTAYTCIASLYEIILFIPMVSLTIRRLRDVGKSAWWILFGLLGTIGQIFLIIWLAKPTGFRATVWYDGYKENPNDIKPDGTNSQTKPTEVDKIIADLNELKANNKISEQEYNEIMSKLKK